MGMSASQVLIKSFLPQFPSGVDFDSTKKGLLGFHNGELWFICDVPGFTSECHRIAPKSYLEDYLRLLIHEGKMDQLYSTWIDLNHHDTPLHDDYACDNGTWRDLTTLYVPKTKNI